MIVRNVNWIQRINIHIMLIYYTSNLTIIDIFIAGPPPPPPPHTPPIATSLALRRRREIFPCKKYFVFRQKTKVMAFEEFILSGNIHREDSD